jgi:hypothetical protein
MINDVDRKWRWAVQVKQREAQNPSQAGSCNEFLRQMAFREYSRYLSFHFPFTHERSLLEHLRSAPWKFNHRHFKVGLQLSTIYASMVWYYKA